MPAAARRQARWRETHPEEARSRAIQRADRRRAELYVEGLHFVNGRPTDVLLRKRAPGEEPPHGTEAALQLAAGSLPLTPIARTRRQRRGQRGKREYRFRPRR